MYFCFGVLLKVLYLCAKEGVDGFGMCNALLSCFSAAVAPQLKTARSSAYMNCSENVPPAYSVAAIGQNINQMIRNVTDNVIPLINDNDHKKLVFALQTIVADSQIEDGSYIDGVAKETIIQEANVSLSPFIAHLLCWTVQNSTNKDGQTTVEQITDEWLNALNISENLNVCPPDFSGGADKLRMVLHHRDFDAVFSQVAVSESDNIAIPNSFKCYCLDITESGYSYDNLNNFLFHNIDKYVYDRIEQDTAVKDEKLLRTIVAKALRDLRTHHEEGKNELGELLVFSFLEGALNAPKIMSRFEVENSEKPGIHYSSGIHLLSYGNSGEHRKYQFVFGCSSIDGDICSGIDKAVEKLKTLSIKNNIIEEKNLLDKAFFKKSFDEETSEFLKSLVAPIRKGESPRVGNAFGVFIGYTHKGEGITPENQNTIMQEIEQEITDIVPYIEEAIFKAGLNQNSVYFYFLPFNDAIKDADALLHELIR